EDPAAHLHADHDAGQGERPVAHPRQIHGSLILAVGHCLHAAPSARRRPKRLSRRSRRSMDTKGREKFERAPRYTRRTARELRNPDEPAFSLWKTQYSPLITSTALGNHHSGSAVSHIAA